jgi:hypothetical protein
MITGYVKKRFQGELTGARKNATEEYQFNTSICLISVLQSFLDSPYNSASEKAPIEA